MSGTREPGKPEIWRSPAFFMKGKVIMHTDSAILIAIERALDALIDAHKALAEKYDVRLTTPYLEENLGDIRQAIQDSKPYADDLNARNS